MRRKKREHATSLLFLSCDLKVHSKPKWLLMQKVEGKASPLEKDMPYKEKIQKSNFAIGASSGLHRSAPFRLLTYMLYKILNNEQLPLRQ
jgi:hypothetical protein